MSAASASSLGLFASTFGIIFLAELPDKTILATLLLASRRRPSAVFAGVAAAFVVQSAVAVAFGGVFALLPRRAVSVGAGLLFLSFAAAMWRRREEAEDAESAAGAADFWKTAWVAFVVIFIAEWGDLTQLATAALAAENRSPWTIFLAATSALWSATALAVLLGSRLHRALDPRKLQKAAAVLFAAVGVYCLCR